MRFIVMHIYTENLSSAFNPSRLAPADTHAQGRTLIDTDAIHWSVGHPGRMGVRCLAQGHLGRDKEVDLHPSNCQFHQSF